MRLLFVLLLFNLSILEIFGAICLRNQHVSGGACVTCTYPNTRPAGDDTANGDTTCTSVTVSALPDCGITLPAAGTSSSKFEVGIVTLTGDCTSTELNLNKFTKLVINGGGYTIFAPDNSQHPFITGHVSASGKSLVQLHEVTIDGFETDGTENYGGAILARNTYVEAYKTAFTRNRAEYKGGVIRIATGHLYCEECEFVGNRCGSSTDADARGCAISTSFDKDAVWLRDSKGADNKREGNGEDDFLDSKSTQMVSIDNLSYDVTLTDQVIHLKQVMACPAAGTQSDMWRDGYNYPGGASDTLKIALFLTGKMDLCPASEKCVADSDYNIKCDPMDTCSADEYVNLGTDNVYLQPVMEKVNEEAYDIYTSANVALNQPWGIQVADNGDIYVADNKNHRIVKKSADGTYSVVAGTGTSGTTTDTTGNLAEFNYPRGISLDSKSNPTKLYVADYSNKCLREIDLATSQVSDKWGTCGSGTAYDFIEDVTVMNGDIYVAHWRCVRKIDSTGTVSVYAGVCDVDDSSGDDANTGGDARFGTIKTIANDGTNVFVGEGGTSAGKIKRILSSDTSVKVVAKQVNYLAGITIAGDDIIIVADKIIQTCIACATPGTSRKSCQGSECPTLLGTTSGGSTVGYDPLLSEPKQLDFTRGEIYGTEYGQDKVYKLLTEGTCTSCTSGTNAAGDNPKIGRSVCDGNAAPQTGSSGSGGGSSGGGGGGGGATLCAINEHVVNNVCVSCGDNINDAGDDASGADTTCDCKANFRSFTSYASDNTKKYGSTVCTDTSDCETKCTGDSGCEGHSNNGRTKIQTWGAAGKGGTDPGVMNNIVNIYSTQQAFAALKLDGSVQVWGLSSDGGTDPSISSGAVNIVSTDKAFAALKSDGSVKAWGSSTYGGNDPSITSDVVKIYTNKYAFAALKSDGSVKTWGHTSYGGGAGAPAAGTNCQYNSDGEYVSGTDCTVDITGNDYAFAALKSDGSVKVWGRATYGGTDPGLTSTDNVVSIVSTSQAFAALKSDGTVKAWGKDDNGGCNNAASGTNVKCVPDGLTGVVKIVGKNRFASVSYNSDVSDKSW